MNRTRKLALKRERLTQLDDSQLDGLAGGLAPVAELTLTGNYSDGCVTFRAVCPTTYRTVCDVTYRTVCPA